MCIIYPFNGTVHLSYTWTREREKEKKTTENYLDILKENGKSDWGSRLSNKTQGCTWLKTKLNWDTPWPFHHSELDTPDWYCHRFQRDPINGLFFLPYTLLPVISSVLCWRLLVIQLTLFDVNTYLDFIYDNPYQRGIDMTRKQRIISTENSLAISK